MSGSPKKPCCEKIKNSSDHPHECPSSSCCQRECCSPSPVDDFVHELDHNHDHDHGHDHHKDHGGHSSGGGSGGCCGGEAHHDHDHVHSHKSPRSHQAIDDEDDDCCEEGCGCSCSNALKATNNGDHDHDHGHDDQEEESCGEGCGCDKVQKSTPSMAMDHDHGHSHDHDHSSNKADDDCCEEGCGCSHAAPLKANGMVDHDHDHGHFHEGHQHGGNGSLKLQSSSGDTGKSKNPLHLSPPAIEMTSITKSKSVFASAAATDIETGVIISEKLVCNMCDPTSPVAHAVQVTRFRVANLCCAKEEQLLRKTLDGVTGIEHISVNLIGKYAIIKHCNVDCCAPSNKIVEMLNDKHLGVSIQDINGHDGDKETETLDRVAVFHAFSVTILFFVGLICYLIPSVPRRVSEWIFICSAIVGVFPIAKAAFISIFIQKQIDIHCLMLIAMIGACLGKEYFDASLVVSLFIDATLLEAYIVLEVRKAVSITSARSIPKEAFLSNGTTVAVDKLQMGDVLAVRAGEMVLCDGVVIKGEGVIDESALTGESAPVHKKVNDTAYGGTVVQNGYMEIKISKSPKESLVNRLHNAVEEVQADRGYYATLVDQFSQYWTPFVIIATLILVVIGGGVTDDWWTFVDRGLVLLVLACPCAIVISAPIPSICAISNAAKHGVLIRGSTIVEKMNQVDAVAVDKTGTLSKGFFTVIEKVCLVDGAVDVAASVDRSMLFAASLEQKSTHPLANAIISDYCGCLGDMFEAESRFPETKKIKVLEGVGIEGWVKEDNDWKHVTIGNERIFRKWGGKVMTSKDQMKAVEEFQSRSGGRVVLFVAVDDEVELAMSLADEVRGESKEFVSELHKLGMTVSMLTGDHDQVAQTICKELNIPMEECYARLLPEEKLRYIVHHQSFVNTEEKQLRGHKAHHIIFDIEQNDPERENIIVNAAPSPSPFEERLGESIHQKKHILYVGDGINDSVALAASTVGVAMGAGGSAMAVEAADMVLMTDNLMLIPYSLAICRYACWTIIQNGIFAVTLKVVAVILAIMGKLHLWEAILVDIGSLVFVVLNGMKVLRFKGPERIFKN